MSQFSHDCHTKCSFSSKLGFAIERRIIECIFLFLVFTQHLIANFEDLSPSSPEQIASLHLTEEFVSLLSGQPSLSNIELQVGNLKLQRIYLPPQVCGKYSDDKDKDLNQLIQALSSQIYKRWTVLPHLKIGYNIHSPYLQVPDQNGSVFEFEIVGNKGILKTASFGFSNLRNEQPDATADLRNIECVVDADVIRLIWPDGTERIYKNYYLQQEILPNGKTIRYEYDKELTIVSDHASIKKIGLDHYVTSHGQEARFKQEIKQIKRKHRSFQQLVPVKASSPIYATTSQYNDRILLSSYDQKSFPLSFEYTSQKKQIARVQKLSTPSGSVLFSYDPPIAGQKGGSTTVKYEDGASKIYRFNQDLLLVAIENWLDGNLVNQKIFTYDKKQHVCCIEIRDHARPLLKTYYECDQAGNPIYELREGDFGSFSIKRAFSRNRLIREERDDGFWIEYTYLENTRLITSKSIPGRKTIYTYDEHKNLIEEEEIGKTKIWYRYDAQQRLEWREEENVGKIRFGYDQWDNICEEQHFGSDGKLAYKIQRTYNQCGQILEETNPLGQIAHYEYDSRGRCIREVPFSNRLVIERSFDAKGRLILLKEGDRETSYKYNSLDELIEQTDDLGFTQRYIYHPVHRKPTRIEHPLTQITYDSFGREVERTDSYGAKIQKRFNSYGDVIEIIYPEGGVETFTYAPNRNLLIHIDADGLQISYIYDPLHRVLSKKVGNQETTYLYDAYHLLKERDALGIETQYRYDSIGRKIEETRASHAVRFGYDPLGFLAWEERGNRRIDYTRDVLGRVLKKSVDGSLETSWSYDPCGKVATITRGDGVTSYTYDAHDRLIEKRDPEGKVSTIEYLKGHQTVTHKMIDPIGNVSLETYDPHGLLLKRDLGGEILEEFVYDQALRLISHDHLRFTYTRDGKKSSCTEAGSRTTLYSYTKGGKLQTKQKPDGTILSYQYDAQGRLSKVGDREFRYDALNRLVGGSGFFRTLDEFGNLLREEWETGLWVESRYDEWNRPLERILSDQSRISYAYEGPFLKKVSRLNKNGAVVYSHTYDQRNSAGKVICETGLFSTTYHYDKAGRKISQNNPYVSETMTYDPAGRLIRRGDTIYSYDGASQLTSESGKFTTQYDRHYNRIGTVDALNQMIDAAYDQNGNLIRPGFVYDTFDQLIEAGGESNRYDALGRRIAKGNRAYLYLDEEEIGVFEGGFAKELKIPGEEGPVAIEINGECYAPIADVQGTIRFLINGNTKAIAQRNDCDAFGAGITDAIPYAYAGKRFDATTGLLYFGRRYYDPSQSRWLTPDPLGSVDHSNLYQYVFNNPFVYHDPYGESVSGYLLGVLEMTAGAALCIAGGVFEIGSFGTLSLGFAFVEGSGIALITDGYMRAAVSAKDIKISSFPSFDGQSLEGCFIPDGYSAPYDFKQAADYQNQRMEARKKKEERKVEQYDYDHPDAPPHEWKDLNPKGPPIKGYEWKGKGPPGSREGKWVKGEIHQETLRPDFDHGPPIGSHWDYEGPNHQPHGVRIYPNGKWGPK